MTIARILLVVTHEAADTDIDGSTFAAGVRQIYANLPARYLDIVVRDWEVTERDRNGAVVSKTCDVNHPRGETPFEIPTDPPLDEETEPERRVDDGIEEWDVMFRTADTFRQALVLKAKDVFAAAERVKQEFPHCRIVRIEESGATEETHAMAFLDKNEIILPVGGPRVPRTPESAQ